MLYSAAAAAAAAAAVTDSCLVMTLRTATRFFDMGPTVTHDATHLSPINCRLCPELRHPWGHSALGTLPTTFLERIA
jgi:hypothetical protein